MPSSCASTCTRPNRHAAPPSHEAATAATRRRRRHLRSGALSSPWLAGRRRVGQPDRDRDLAAARPARRRARRARRDRGRAAPHRDDHRLRGRPGRLRRRARLARGTGAASPVDVEPAGRAAGAGVDRRAARRRRVADAAMERGHRHARRAQRVPSFASRGRRSPQRSRARGVARAPCDDLLLLHRHPVLSLSRRRQARRADRGGRAAPVRPGRRPHAAAGRALGARRRQRAGRSSAWASAC